MCLSIFCTSCSSGEEENPETMNTDAEIKPVTLTLYAPTKGTTTQEQIDIVQEAFNNITQSKFNTNVVLKLIPEDKYAETITATIEKIEKQIEEEEAAEQSRFEAEKEALIKGETLPPEETEAPETNVASDPDSPEISYPAEKENQLDIFLVNSFETYYDLVMNNRLSALDEEITEGSKLLNAYVYPYNIKSAYIDGSIYGVFNNTVFGDYQYLLLNKELVDKYDYDPEEMSTLSSITMFLKEVKEKEAGVIPFLGNPEAPVAYWNDTESLIGVFCEGNFTSSGHIDATSFLPDVFNTPNLMEQSGYRKWLASYNELYQAGCLVEKTTANEKSKFAATVIDGDVTLSPTYADEYGNYKTDKYGFKYITGEDGVDYYVSVYKRPIATKEAIYGAGYVVSAYTEHLDRCMQVLTALNTDATLSNLFMYGVKDVHYTVDEETGIVHKTTDAYAMDYSTIGNIYLLKESDDMNDYWKFMSKNDWQNAKNTNQEAIINPFVGFVYNPEKPTAEQVGEEQLFVDKTFDEVMAEVLKVSEKYMKELYTYKDTAEQDYEAYQAKIREILANDQYIITVSKMNQGIYYITEAYKEWYADQYDYKFEA